jgi:hypothetical protein
MRYNGGSCSNSFNSQPSTVFSCEDGFLPPPTTTSVFIEATAGANPESGSPTYFSGVVEPGGIFNLTNPEGGLLDSRTTIVIRTGDVIFQTVVFGTDCEVDLSLNDRYGANSIVQWINTPQGAVDVFPEDVDLTYTITNTGRVPAMLTSLETTISETNPNSTETVNFIVANQVVPVGGNFVVPLEYEISLAGGRRQYTVGASARAMQGGLECAASSTIQFDAGYTEF